MPEQWAQPNGHMLHSLHQAGRLVTWSEVRWAACLRCGSAGPYPPNYDVYECLARCHNAHNGIRALVLPFAHDIAEAVVAAFRLGGPESASEVIECIGWDEPTRRWTLYDRPW